MLQKILIFRLYQININFWYTLFPLFFDKNDCFIMFRNIFSVYVILKRFCLCILFSSFYYKFVSNYTYIITNAKEIGIFFFYTINLLYKVAEVTPNTNSAYSQRIINEQMMNITYFTGLDLSKENIKIIHIYVFPIYK